MYDVIIRDGTIVRSSGRLVADIAIQDGKIAYVGGNPAGPAKEEISAIGRFVMPGVIDAHVHFRQAGFSGKESWATGSAEALRGVGGIVLDAKRKRIPHLLCVPCLAATCLAGTSALAELAPARFLWTVNRLSVPIDILLSLPWFDILAVACARNQQPPLEL